jgi:outer membrane protein assembly factor BamB
MGRMVPDDRSFRPSPRSVGIAAGVVSALVVATVGWVLVRGGDGGGSTGAAPPASVSVRTPKPANRAVRGVTTFRGNATRSYYGRGPVPLDPVVRWRHPEVTKLCSESIVGVDVTEWCGTGWTGQPNVIEVPGGGVEVREGAYDGRYHFVDGETGEPVRSPLVTLDLAKGSATTDPDGFPLYYAGSRDGHLRVVALDRDAPETLWSIDGGTSAPRPLRNDDWDGAPLVIRDHLLAGGENGWFYVIRLDRAYGEDGLVTVAPEVVATIPGFDDELLAVLGDQEVSIENSVAYRRGVAYFANSGGLVQGWDIGALLDGGTEVERVLRFWVGDDVDASIAIDGQGFLYVAAEYQRFNDRSRKVGQLMKLDPRRPEDPLIWSIDAREIGFEGAGGSWSTPALYGDVVFFSTAAGRVLEVDRGTGTVLHELQVGAPSIASPVVVDGVLILGDCLGDLYAWDVTDPSIEPPLLWKMRFEGCIESTPAVWRGWLYLGTREGYLYGIADAAGS